MKILSSFFLMLRMLLAFNIEDIKEKLEDINMYAAVGVEYLDVLDGTATNLIVGTTAFVPEIHELLVVELSSSYSVRAASQSATDVYAAYSVRIFNLGAYAGYMIESRSAFSLIPKVGLQLVYASSSKSFGMSLMAGVRANYELEKLDMNVFADVVLLSGAQIFSAGLSMPFEFE